MGFIRPCGRSKPSDLGLEGWDGKTNNRPIFLIFDECFTTLNRLGSNKTKHKNLGKGVVSIVF